MSKRLILIIAVSIIFLSSAGIVTFLSAQEGADIPAKSSSAARAQVTPLETQFAPDRIYRTSGAAVWRVSRDAGLLVSEDGGKTWTERDEGLPHRAVYPFDADKPAIITGLAIDPVNEDRVAVTTMDTLYLSEDAGVRWTKIELKDPIRANDQLTCVALSPQSAETLSIGTSFHGFFESVDGGKKWTSLSEPLAHLKLGGGNYEEIASVAYDPVDSGLIWFSLGFGKGIYTMRRGTRDASRIETPAGLTGAAVRDIAFRRTTEQTGWRLEAHADDARWSFQTDAKAWSLEERIQRAVSIPADKAQRLAAAADKYGIYMSSFWASGKLLQTHLKFLKANGLNSVVLDFKDDFGDVTYDTTLAAPWRIGAVKKRFKVEDIVKTAHDNGLYLIGRIVVFRDKQLYNADGFAYAAWDKAAKAPWRFLKKSVDEETGAETVSQGEYWVDPYSEYVWDYNIAIAKELQERGVDEIQFDYIRFPSDGDLSRLAFRYRKPHMGKLEALESFLAKARENISIPISTDVYGYCGWARISNWVAQNIETYSHYVDVIQPMFYPSHFPRDFLGSMEYMPRAKYIYEEGSNRSAYIVEGRALVRPYVQTFRIGGELAFTPPVYTRYVVNQVQGCLQGASSGFTLWNASNDYYMVTVPLGPIIQNKGVIPERAIPPNGGAKR